MNLVQHPTKVALEGLLPEVYVSGGTFEESLPHPKTVPSDERQSLLETTRKEAVTTTVNSLLQSADSEETAPVKKSSRGNRLWPEGRTGSITHKGTVVLGALSQAGNRRSIGIDIELDQYGGRGLSQILCNGEKKPKSETISPLLIVFSAKEAVYKAVYPVCHQVLDFDDVYLHWEETSSSRARGVADCSGQIEADVRCTCVANWVVSAATVSLEDQI